MEKPQSNLTIKNWLGLQSGKITNLPGQGASYYYVMSFVIILKVKDQMLPTILLLQARNAGDPAKDEERASFAQKANFDQARIVPHDIVTEPLTLRKVRKFDALMVGGSGDYYVSKANLPHARLSKFLTNLTGSGLINKIEFDGKNTFVITPKGRQYLESYQKFSNVAQSFGLEL